MRNFGFRGYDEVAPLGTNGKMSEASAAMGVTSLESLGSFLAANQRNHEQDRDRLAGRPGLTRVCHPPWERWNHHYAVVEIDAGAAGLAGDQLHRLLWPRACWPASTFIPALTPWLTAGEPRRRNHPLRWGESGECRETRLMSLTLA